MAQLSIDPVTNYYRVGQTLLGRVLLFFLAGWCGIFLGRFCATFEKLGDLLRPWEGMSKFFGAGFGVIGELLVMAFWPISTVMSASNINIWLFFLAISVIAIVFVVFIYSEEPAPAWWLGLVGFVAVMHVAGINNPSVAAWIMLSFIITGIGAALYWALRVFHPELCESVGDLLKGRNSRPGYLSYAGRPTDERTALREPPKGVSLPTTRSRESSGE